MFSNSQFNSQEIKKLDLKLKFFTFKKVKSNFKDSALLILKILKLDFFGLFGISLKLSILNWQSFLF